MSYDLGKFNVAYSALMHTFGNCQDNKDPPRNASSHFPRFHALRLHSTMLVHAFGFNQFVLSRDIDRAVIDSRTSSLQDTNDMPDDSYFTHIAVHTFKTCFQIRLGINVRGQFRM